MTNFILNLIIIITGVILLSLSYMYKKKVTKTDYDKFNLKWCSTLGIVSLANGVFGITNLSKFIYVYYLLNIAFLTLSGIFAYKTLKLLNAK